MDEELLGLIEFISDADVFDEGDECEDEEMIRRDYCDNDMGIQ